MNLTEQAPDKGTLYLIPTPIGNLGDMTFRAIEVMRQVDILLAEDTRTTRKLLTHFDIKTRIHSYHGFNEKKKLESILTMLQNGKSIGLVSESGMPGISDPGSMLSLACHERNIPVIVLPGASAAVTAMVASGFEIQGHMFQGFLPKKPKERIEKLKELAVFPGAVIIYESPYRIAKVLEEMKNLMPKREIHIAREISKIHEEHFHGKIEVICNKAEISPRGEYVMVLSPLHKKDASEQSVDFSKVLEFKELCSNLGLSTKDAAGLYAKATRYNKSEIYKIMNKKNRGKQYET